MDCVFFGRASGWLVVRDPNRKINVYWSEIERETMAEYQCARDTLEAVGFTLLAVVADGKPGLKPLFRDLPMQMCHFHMKAIITFHLTRRPKLDAGKELRMLTHSLCNTNEIELSKSLSSWHEKWGEFLMQRTVDEATGRWRYTHRRLRAAYRSLVTHLPYLFTYQRHTELLIPNTTNTLEGSFAHLKQSVLIHRGLKPDLKRKMITSIIQNSNTKS